MKKNLIALLLGLFTCIGAGCASSAAPMPAQPVITPTQKAVPVSPQKTVQATTEQISISGFSFQPAAITIARGSTIIWSNQDPIDHTITADDGSFDSGDLQQSETYRHTFANAGTFTYHCKFHPSMQGTVTVQ